MSDWVSVEHGYDRVISDKDQTIVKVRWEALNCKWRWDYYNARGWVAHSNNHNTAMAAMGDADAWMMDWNYGAPPSGQS